MSYIAHLDMTVNGSLEGERWQALARSAGAPLMDFGGPLGHIAKVVEFIRGAAGFVLPHENFLLTPETAAAITESVFDGRRMLVALTPNSIERVNPWLKAFGLGGTRIALHQPTGGRLIGVNRRDSPNSFRPHPLLEGVGSLLLQHPNAVQYSGATVPIVTLAADKYLAVDQETDFPSNWHSPELSCLVLSPVGERGGVLAAACGFWHDPYAGATGVEFPGIAAEDNERLTLNIISWLAGGRLPDRTSAAVAFDLLDRIERGLVDFVLDRLNRAFDDGWTEGVPLAVRTKCATRCEEEGNRLPKPSYLDVLDLKSIFEKNWQLFQTDLQTVGWVGGKTAALGWFTQFNETRKNVMHPARRHFVPTLVDDQVITWLEELRSKVDRLRVGGGDIVEAE